jgi:hypothetical protein
MPEMQKYEGETADIPLHGKDQQKELIFIILG